MALIEDFEAFTSRAINIGDKALLLSGQGTPETDYPDVPVGTFYFNSNGKLYRKTQDTGSGIPSDWVEGGGGSGNLNQSLPFFLSDGTPDNIPLNLGGLPFFLSDGTPKSIAII